MATLWGGIRIIGCPTGNGGCLGYGVRIGRLRYIRVLPKARQCGLPSPDSKGSGLGMSAQPQGVRVY
eukprot:9550857-Ditylum_brightwellii.AAC.1